MTAGPARRAVPRRAAAPRATPGAWSWAVAGLWLAAQLVFPAVQLSHRPARFGWHMYADLREFPVLVGVVAPRGDASAAGRRDTIDVAAFLAFQRGDVGPDFVRRLVAHVCARRPQYAAVEERDAAHAHGPPVRVTPCR
ncbi:hypothetical protein tb265_16000 [Gemmatimonadetes bacterium T265]|nr:hypothetical protein tb265_16000 [Gemmatimonadetes bacterium T265]